MAYFQDLSYLTAKDGTQIKPKHLIKSSRVSKYMAKKLDVKKIIDLRTKNEISLFPEKFDDNVIYKHMPYFDMRITGITYEKNIILNELHDIRTMEETYKEMVTNPKYIKNLSRIIKEIINSDLYPVLYHCSQGKDRTGITTFILLNILGFDEETIMNDYLLLSDDKLMSYLAYAFALLAVRNKETASKIKSFMQVDEKYLTAAINAIESNYGNIDGFIKEGLDITNFEKEEFREKVLIKK